MVVTAQYRRLLGSRRLSNLWIARYYSKNSENIQLAADEVVFNQCPLEYVASPVGRRKTLEKLDQHVIQDACRLAAVRTKDLYIPYEVLMLEKTSELAQFTAKIYPLLLHVYQVSTPTVVFSQFESLKGDDKSFKVFAPPEIDVLVNTLDPFLSDFQTLSDEITTDWQTRSFLTTQISLANGLLLDTLNSAEQVLLKPYFDFLEEYVGIPWQRLCIVAGKHSSASSMVTLVERMVPKIPETSIAVYRQWCQEFVHYRSRRGQLDHPGIVHSALRDFDMFQVYLWICVLTGNLDVIEHKLLRLCALVYRGLDIPWEMTIRGVELLAQEILQQLSPHQRERVLPYTQGMQMLFEDFNS